MEVSKYFDYAATSLPDKEILEKALAMSLEYSGNPSSVHQIGKNAALVLQDARWTAAKVLGVKAENIYFTSGGTESDQIALLSILNKPQNVLVEEYIEAEEYNLNIPRYVNASVEKMKPDLKAHLLGGIPMIDVNGFDNYWKMAPNLKNELFSNSSNWRNRAKECQAN